MARIRTTKPEFWTSEQIAECSPLARLLFIGMWNFCDDSGVHPASVKRLKMEIFPSDDITTENIQRMINELSANSLIKQYTVDNNDYFIVTGWDKHQRIDQPTYKFPLPTGEVPETIRRTFNRHSPPERKGSGKEAEGNGKEKARAKRATPPPDSFSITDDLRAWASEKNIRIDLESETDRFLDYYRGNGKAQKDWVATWRNWMRKAQEYAKDKPSQNTDDGFYTPAPPADDFYANAR